MNGEVINQGMPSNNFDNSVNNNMINTTVEGLSNVQNNSEIVIPNDTLNAPTAEVTNSTLNVEPEMQNTESIPPVNTGVPVVNQSSNGDEEVIPSGFAMPTFTPDAVTPNIGQNINNDNQNTVVDSSVPETPVVNNESTENLVTSTPVMPNAISDVNSLPETNSQTPDVPPVETTLVDSTDNIEQVAEPVNNAAPISDNLAEQSFVETPSVETQITTPPVTEEVQAPVAPVVQDNAEELKTPEVENVDTTNTNDATPVQEQINQESVSEPLTPAETTNLVENNKSVKLADIQAEIEALRKYNEETLSKIQEQFESLKENNEQEDMSRVA